MARRIFLERAGKNVRAHQFVLNKPSTNSFEWSHMELSTKSKGSVQIVSINGSLDALTAPELADALAAELRGGRARLVADLSGLEYTSSAGLRVLLNNVKDARSQGGDLRLAGVQPNVKKVLDLSGFMSIMKSYADVDAAVASFAE
ncbi:MAG: anti-sigma factor antagonist [Chloroflexota bacterium]|nr:MAG: anti-sigma factor antagonist [Chloroflexota bacterium]